jgi:hypothetical protein
MSRVQHSFAKKTFIFLRFVYYSLFTGHWFSTPTSDFVLILRCILLFTLCVHVNFKI